MSRDDPVLRLRHMLDHAREVVVLVRARSRADLDDDRLLNLALVRLCEVIGEAASKVSIDVRRRHSEIPWSQIVSFRNRLIHGYDSVDFDILWQIVSEDIPSLVAALEKILSDAQR